MKIEAAAGYKPLLNPFSIPTADQEFLKDNNFNTNNGSTVDDESSLLLVVMFLSLKNKILEPVHC